MHVVLPLLSEIDHQTTINTHSLSLNTPVTEIGVSKLIAEVGASANTYLYTE